MLKNSDERAYWQMLSRQKDIISKEEQQSLKNSTILLVGCGGIGGAAAEMLARMGFQKLKAVDKDVFEISNLNRQIMSNREDIGFSKSIVTRNNLLQINPEMKIEAFEEEINLKNVKKFLNGCDLVIDAVDNLISRIIISRQAQEKNIPFIHGAIHATKGQITTFTKRTPSYEAMFNLPSHDKEITSELINKIETLNKTVPPSIGPVPNIIGCLQASEAMKLLTKKGAPIMAPNLLVFDLLKKNPFTLSCL